MALLNNDVLSALGFLSTSQTIVKGYTDKANNRLSLPRLLHGDKECFEINTEVTTETYKCVVLADWAFMLTSNASTRKFYLEIWQEWIEMGHLLYVLDGEQLIKINTAAALPHYKPYLYQVIEPAFIYEQMAAHGFAADEVLLVDLFKAQELTGLLAAEKSPPTIARATPDAFHRVDVINLVNQNVTDFHALANSLKHYTSASLFLSPTGVHKEKINLYVDAVVSLLQSGWITEIIIISEALSILEQALNKLPCQDFYIKAIISRGIALSEPALVKLIRQCPQLSALNYNHPSLGEPLPADCQQRLAQLSTLEIDISHLKTSTQLFKQVHSLTLTNQKQENTSEEAYIRDVLSKIDPHKIERLRLLNIKQPQHYLNFPKLISLELILTGCANQCLNETVFAASQFIDYPKLKNVRISGFHFKQSALPRFLTKTPLLENLLIDSYSMESMDENYPEMNLKKLSILNYILCYADSKEEKLPVPDYPDELNPDDFNPYEQFNTTNQSHVVQQLLTQSANTLEDLSIQIDPYFNRRNLVLPYLTQFNCQLSMCNEHTYKFISDYDDNEFDDEIIANIVLMSPNVRTLSFDIINLINSSPFNQLGNSEIIHPDFINATFPKLSKLTAAEYLGCNYLLALINASPKLEDLTIVSGFNTNFDGNYSEANYVHQLKENLHSTPIRRCTLVTRKGDTAIVHPLRDVLARLTRPKHLSVQSSTLDNFTTIHANESLKLISIKKQLIAALSPDMQLKSLELWFGTLDEDDIKNIPRAALKEVTSLSLRGISITNYASFILFLKLFPKLEYLEIDTLLLNSEHFDNEPFHAPLLKSLIITKCSAHQELIRAANNIERLECTEFMYPNTLRQILQSHRKLRFVNLATNPCAKENLEQEFPQVTMICFQTQPSTRSRFTSPGPTSSPPNPVFYPVEYYRPKQDGANSKIAIHNYRLQAHTAPAQINNKQQLIFSADQLTPDLIYSDEQVQSISKDVASLDALYATNYEQHASIAASRDIPIILNQQDWTPIPSLSANDELIAIHLKALFQLARSHQGIYLIKLKEGIENEFILKIIVRFQHHALPYPGLNKHPLTQQETHRLYLHQAQELFSQLVFFPEQNKPTLKSRNQQTIDLQQAFQQIRERAARLLHRKKEDAWVASFLNDFNPNNALNREKPDILNVETCDQPIIPSDVTLHCLNLFKVYIESFQAGQLIGPATKATDLLNSLLQEKKGACRHRSFLFKALCDAINIPCSLIYNELHAFIEVQVSSIYYSIDLGGYAAVVKKQPAPRNQHKRKLAATNITADGDTSFHPPSLTDSEESLMEEPATTQGELMSTLADTPASSETEQNELNEAKKRKTTPAHPLELFNEHSNPFITWSKKNSAQPSFALYWQELETKIATCVLGAQNILLSFKSQEQLLSFREALLKQKKQAHHRAYRIDSLNTIAFREAYVTDGDYTLVDSQLVNYLKADAQQGDALIIDWSSYKPQHISYNSIVDTAERKIGTHKISAQMSVIVLIEEAKAQNLREDFYSRFRIKEDVPATMVYPAKPPFVMTANEAGEFDRVDLLLNEDWEQVLIGSLALQGQRIGAQPGILAAACNAQNPKAGLIIYNPPEQATQLLQFLTQLSTQREFYFNHRTYTLPEHYVVHLAEQPLNWRGNYTLSKMTDENFALCTHVLNSETYNLFFTAYEYTQANRGDGQAMSDALCAKEGWLTQKANLTILVSSSLRKSQWIRLIDQLRQQECTVQFILQNSQLPSEMLAKGINPGISAQPVFDGVEPMEIEGNEPPAPKNTSPSTVNNNKSIQLVCEDPEFALDALQETTRIDLVMTLSPETSYDLIERISLKKRADNQQSLAITYTIGALASALLAKKTVVLKVYEGMLAPSLEKNLESLFLEKPYLWLNGQQKSFTGQLIIISDSERYFPWCKKQYKAIEQTEIRDLLLQHATPERVNSLLEYCTQTPLKLSYVQAKTWLKRNHPLMANSLKSFNLANASLSNLAKEQLAAPATASQDGDELSQRTQQIKEFQAHDPCVFLIGPTGSGKSSIVLQNLRASYGPDLKLYVGMENLALWANDQSRVHALLFIDEANLLAPGALQIFDDLYNQKPGIVIAGAYIPLTAKHQVIFAGNTQDYVGRIHHAINSRRGHFLAIPELTKESMHNKFIKPFIKDKAVIEQVIKVCMLTYDFMKQIKESTLAFTPRNLKNIVLRFNQLHEKLKANNLLESLWLSCYDELRYILSPKLKQQFKHMMSTHIQLEAYQTLKKTLIEQEGAQINFPNYATTHVRARRLIKQFLELKDTAGTSYNGSGLLLEGPPGIGKSTLVHHYLQYLNINFAVLHAQNKDEAEQFLHECFHAGKVVVIDELNTMPFLEYSLNSLMMGEDLSGNKAKASGFRVIATQNPISFGGRYALSPALANRFIKVQMKEYTEADLIAIAKSQGLDKQESVCHAQEYLTAKSFAEKNHLHPAPTARDYVNSIQFFAAKNLNTNAQRSVQSNPECTMQP